VSDWSALDFLTLNAIAIEPASPTNVRLSHVADNMNIAFDEVQDYRPIRYEFRLGDTFDGALYMDDRAHGPFPVFGDGTYWVAAYVFPEGTAKVYSAAVSIAVANTLLTSNIIVQFTDSDDGWLGTFSGAAGRSGAVIRTAGQYDYLGLTDFLAENDFLDGGESQGSGNYYSDTVVGIGRVAPCYVGINWQGAGSQVNSDYLALLDVLTQGDVLGAESSAYVEVYPILRVSQTTDITDGEWVKYAPGSYVGRTFQPGIALISNDVTTIASCISMQGFVDVPDRYDEIANLAVVSGGSVITFRPKGDLVDAPFNGGPNGETTPHIQTTIIGSTAGDEVVVSSLTLAGCTVKVRNAGVFVDRSGVNVTASGF